MDWRDQGILVAARRHGEAAAIIEVFTEQHGRHAGVVHGGTSRRMAPVLQPGTELSVEWRARLADHIGTFRVDPIRAHAATVLGDRAALAALGAVTALISAALPEREAHLRLYGETRALLAMLGLGPDWPARYFLWELDLLAELGFGLDLARCAATGVTDDLAYVSPRTGRAVSIAAAAPYLDKLLPLPGFLRDRRPVATEPGDPALAAAARLTGHFLETRLGPALPRERLPAARNRAVAAILDQARTNRR